MTSGDRRGVAPLPVTVLTGYLGAGKTTLLNRILSERHGRRYAVVVNEFGELGIDGDLVVGTDEEVVTLSNGCLCCDVRGDLLRTVKALLPQAADLDGIIVETSGLADPAPIVQTFFIDAEASGRTRLDSVVALVDAKHVHDRLADAPETAAQIVAADLIVLNKEDLVSAAEADVVEATIRALNPFADVRRTTRSALPIAEVLDRQAFDLRRVVEGLPGFAEPRARHAASIEAASFRIDRPVQLDRLLRWIDSVVALHGGDVMRVKALLDVEGEDRPFVFQAVNRVMDGDFLAEWPGAARSSKLVVIGRNLDRERLRRNFEGCQAPRPAPGTRDLAGRSRGARPMSTVDPSERLGMEGVAA